jgi:hypothetical protein
LASSSSPPNGGSILLSFINSPPSPLYFIKRGDLIDIDLIIMIKMLLSRRFLVSMLRVDNDKLKLLRVDS